MSFKRDFVVVGGGPAGEKGAVTAAYFGRRVLLVEKEPHLGGACVNLGTLPSKTLRETCLHLSGFKQRGIVGARRVPLRPATPEPSPGSYGLVRGAQTRLRTRPTWPTW